MSYRNLLLLIVLALVFACPSFAVVYGNPVYMVPNGMVYVQSCWNWSTGGTAVGLTVYWSLTSNANAGYHVHNSPNSPTGRLASNPTITGADGCAPNQYWSPSSAGYKVLTTTSPGQADYSLSNIQIYIPNLAGVPAGSGFSLVGATQSHPWNTYGTPWAVQQIQILCRSFHAMHPDHTAGINDMSLPWGGTFDLGPSYGGAWWSPPHAEHALGLNVDCPFRYLDPYRSDFFVLAVKNGGNQGCNPSNATQCGIINEGDHYHLRFNH